MTNFFTISYAVVEIYLVCTGPLALAREHRVKVGFRDGTDTGTVCQKIGPVPSTVVFALDIGAGVVAFDLNDDVAVAIFV
jgi:hypothetical protein